MSVIIPITKPNKNSYFFALAGGGAASLQSPVVVTPDAATGNATIAVIADPAIATGQAGLSVISSANSPGTILVGGYGTDYSVGVPSQPAAVPPALPQFEIGVNDGVTPPVFVYNSGTGAVVIGDGSADVTATVELRQPLVLGSTLGGANRLILTQQSATAASIVQTIASGGTVEIGSSQAALATVSLSDAGAGSANVIIGGNAGSGLQLIGGATNATNAIRPAIASGGGLSIGSSFTTNPSAIVITDSGVGGTGRTVILNQAPPALVNNICTIQGQQATIPTSTENIDLPAGVVLTDGLYYFAVNVTGVGNAQFQASCIVYYNGATFSTGGATQSPVDGNGKYLQLYPNGATMVISWNGNAVLPGYVVLCPIFNAPIIGFA
jgi:hypothetical protein